MISIRVPATTANLGPGFDCLGLALDIYNTIDFFTDVDRLIIENGSPDVEIETDENNLIYKAFKRLYEYLKKDAPPVRIVQNINIPISRGLGSSAASIIGGLMGANEMLGRPLDNNRILELATEIEGHPDNVAPALLGGMVVSIKTENGVKYIRHPVNKDIKLMALIPDFTLSTTMARSVLPSMISCKDALFNVGRSSFLTASLITGNLENVRYAVEDKLHQPYRLELIADGKKICDAAYARGADAFFISGSGSTLMTIVSNHEVVGRMQEFCSNLDAKWDVKLINIDNEGVQVLRS